MSVNYVFVFYKAMIIFADKHYKGTNARMLKLLINASIYVRAFFALIQQFIAKYWLFLADIALLVAGMLFLINYWENQVIHDDYPIELFQIHIPYYILFWVGTVLLSGGYEKPYSVKRIVQGVFFGTVLIAAVYGILPNNLRFSRALFILGGVWAGISFVLTRLIHHIIQYKNLNLGSAAIHRVVVVGNKAESQRVKSLLNSNKMEFIGYINATDWQGDDVIGPVSRLDELVKLYKINEIVFCSSDVSSTEIMKWMQLIGTQKVHFKTVPDERHYLIGSNSKDSNGEWYAQEIVFNLNEKSNQRSKRLFDIIASVIAILFSPILLFISKQKIGPYFKNCALVLISKKTWVAYNQSVNTLHLPKLKEEVYPLTLPYKKEQLDKQTINRLNFMYAKTYHIDQDIQLLLKSFKN